MTMKERLAKVGGSASLEVVGQVGAAVTKQLLGLWEASHQDWESFMRERVFEPAGMARSVSDEKDRFANPNRVQPHARLDPRVRWLGAQRVLPLSAKVR